jgi:predicted phage tail protein
VTCEDVDFRGGKNQIKTFPCDFILVANGYDCHHSLYSGLRTAFEATRKRTLSDDCTHPEPGFFTLGPIKKRDQERYSLHEGLTQVSRVREKMLEFFTKVGE